MLGRLILCRLWLGVPTVIALLWCLDWGLASVEGASGGCSGLVLIALVGLVSCLPLVFVGITVAGELAFLCLSLTAGDRVVVVLLGLLAVVVGSAGAAATAASEVGCSSWGWSMRDSAITL